MSEHIPNPLSGGTYVHEAGELNRVEKPTAPPENKSVKAARERAIKAAKPAATPVAHIPRKD